MLDSKKELYELLTTGSPTDVQCAEFARAYSLGNPQGFFGLAQQGGVKTKLLTYAGPAVAEKISDKEISFPNAIGITESALKWIKTEPDIFPELTAYLNECQIKPNEKSETVNETKEPEVYECQVVGFIHSGPHKPTAEMSAEERVRAVVEGIDFLKDQYDVLVGIMARKNGTDLRITARSEDGIACSKSWTPGVRTQANQTKRKE